MQFAKVVNRFGVESTVPIHKAREMQMNGDIDDFDLITEELEGTNVQAPQTSLRGAEEEVEVVTRGRPRKSN